MSKFKSTFGIVALFAASAALGSLTFAPAPPAADSGHGAFSPAIWASDAMVPAELVPQSDLVARVQVVSQDAAFAVVPEPFRSPLVAAQLAADGKPVPELVFTPSIFEVLEVYHGAAEVGDRIKVMQTGGVIGDERSELLDDPLYELGSEHVLFLRDTSREGLRASVDPIYVTHNPASRYQVLGGQLEAQTSFFGPGVAAPTDLSSFEADIRAAAAAGEGEGK